MIDLFDVGLIASAISAGWALLKDKKFSNELVIIFFIMLVLKLTFGN